MIKSHTRLFFTFLPYILVLSIGIFFHFYNFSKASFFYSDQGGDLLIARAILNNGHRPLVGPVLSAEGFYIPPTYYYLLAAFLALGKTPLGTAVVFAVANLVAMGVFMATAARLVDRKTALITGLLFAATVVVHEHGRYMWQPHPALWFEIGMLFCFLRAKIQKKPIWIVCALASYTLSVSIYPSALLLLPYVLSQVVSWCRGITREKRLVIMSRVIAWSVFVSVMIYVPLIIFEFQHNFPTMHALQSASFGHPPTLGEVASIYLKNFYVFGETVANLAYISPSFWRPLTISMFGVVLLLWCWVRKRTLIAREISDFIGLRWVLLGSLAVLFYRLEIAHWRTWFLLPYWLLIFAVVTRFGFSRKQLFVSVIVFIMAWLYLLGNMLRFYRWTITTPLNTLGYYVSIASIIKGSMQKNGYDPQDVGVVLFTPEEEQGSWGATPLLYFLHEDIGLPISITKEGNIVDTWGVVTSIQPTKYLVCTEYASIEKIQDGCVKKFLQVNGNYVQKGQWLAKKNTMIFLYNNSNRFTVENNRAL